MTTHETPGCDNTITTNCDEYPAGRGAFELRRPQRVLVETSGGLYTVAKTENPRRLRWAPGRKSNLRHPATYDVRERITPTDVTLGLL